MIQADKITVEREGKRILNSVSLSVPRGSFFGIIGPNGSGKTTLMNVLARLITPDTGTVMVKGKDINRYKRREYARLVAVVSQEQTGEFSFTVREVVGMGYYPHEKGLFFVGENESRTDEMLLRCGIIHLEDRDIRTLSGGEYQRVMIARALVQQPEILLLDEPTSHLDIRHQVEQLSLIKGFLPSLTVIAVLHDLNLAAHFSDLMAVVHEGTIRTGGDPQCVLTPSILREVFGVTAEVLVHPVTRKPVIYPWYTGEELSRHDLFIHLISGGGSGSSIIPLLLLAGCTLSCGILSRDDSDFLTATSAGIPIIWEPAFTPMTEESYIRLIDSAERSDGVIIAPMPVGIGNIPNIRALGNVNPKKIGVIGTRDSWIERDFTNGELTDLLSEMEEKGARFLDGTDDLIGFLDYLDTRSLLGEKEIH